jgi:hypothetical protein
MADTAKKDDSPADYSKYKSDPRYAEISGFVKALIDERLGEISEARKSRAKAKPTDFFGFFAGPSE